MLIISDLASAVLYASLPVAAWAHVLTIGQVLFVELVAGAAGIFFTTAYIVYLPVLVRKDDLLEGNAKLSGAGSGIVFGAIASNNIVLISFRQTYTPAEIMGRVIASQRFLVFGTAPLGALAAGRARHRVRSPAGAVGAARRLRALRHAAA